MHDYDSSVKFSFKDLERHQFDCCAKFVYDGTEVTAAGTGFSKEKAKDKLVELIRGKRK